MRSETSHQRHLLCVASKSRVHLHRAKANNFFYFLSTLNMNRKLDIIRTHMEMSSFLLSEKEKLFLEPTIVVFQHRWV